MKRRERTDYLWRECGPSLSALRRRLRIGEVDWECLIIEYGELRIRYTAHLLDGLGIDGLQLEKIFRQALQQPFLAPATLRLLAAVGHPLRNDLPAIPWIERYAQGATPRQRLLLNATCKQSISTAHVEQYTFAGRTLDPPLLLSPDAQQLYECGLLDARCTPHPDLTGLSLIMWLSFLIDGERDPLLQGAWHRCNPPQAVAEWGSCAEAVASILATSRARSSRPSEVLQTTRQRES